MWFSIGLGSANASSWTEESFANRIPTRYPVRAADVRVVVGDLETYVVEEGDTLSGRRTSLRSRIQRDDFSESRRGSLDAVSSKRSSLIPTEFVLPKHVRAA